MPEIINSINEIRKFRGSLTGTVGFVPTMGYLHEGHLNLVKEASIRADHVVVSIYVNPSQFGENEDFDSYPRDFDRDIELLTQLKVDAVFLPTDKMIYPEDYKTWIKVDEFSDILCGKSRPDHFRGVATIVAKLLNITTPDQIFLGEKDYQQLIIIKQMVRDLNMPHEVVGCKIVREPDGLAMSSRNKYLSLEERRRALSISAALNHARKLYQHGVSDAEIVYAEIKKKITDNKMQIDYIAIVDEKNLSAVSELRKGCRILIAAYIGKTRLIDNMAIQ
jgi:pantoate--beta-alanine ligase